MRRIALGVTGFLVFSGCAATGRQPAVAVEPDAADVVRESYVYFYPLRAQDEARQSRDRYECYRWAVDQSGFDPGLADLAPHQRVRVVPVTPPGHHVFGGAVAGAIIGALIGEPHHTGDGAAIGAGIGAAVGAAQAVSEQHGASVAEHSIDTRRLAQLEHLSTNYRRATGACLTGRGYAVR